MARCEECLRYEVCMYVNAKAVEYVKAENCKLFKPTADVVPRAMIAEIFGEIDALLARLYNDPSYSSGELGYDIDKLKKKYAEGK